MAGAMIVTAKRAAAAFGKLRFSPLHSGAAAATLPRPFASFSTDAPSPSEERSVEVTRRSDSTAPARRRRRGGDLFPTLFGDVFDPFNPRRSLSEVFNLVDQMMDFPFGAARARWGWDAREDENALYLKMEMPGLGKDDVQVTMEQNTLVIRGEASEEEEEEEGSGGGEHRREGERERSKGRRRYSRRIELPLNQYDMEGMRAEMKNGVLRLVVPKVKAEERKDVRHVPVE